MVQGNCIRISYFQPPFYVNCSAFYPFYISKHFDIFQQIQVTGENLSRKVA